MDILPLAVAVFPTHPVADPEDPWVALAMSFGFYVLVREWQISLSDYPSAQPWKFDPFAWQLLFVIGAVLGALASRGRLRVPRRLPLLVLAAAYAIWAYIVAPTAWEYDGSGSVLPGALNALVFPIMDRTNLSLWRLTHLLVLVYIATWILRAGHPVFGSRVARPLTLCGQHPLPVFCLGVLLSIAGWVVFTEVGADLPYQILVNAGGVALMVLVAFVLSMTSPATPARASVRASRGGGAAISDGCSAIALTPVFMALPQSGPKPLTNLPYETLCPGSAELEKLQARFR